jgi:transcription termination factor Rho
MDEVIFEEFKGTGNSEIILSRKIAEKSIYPAIDILKTGTRREDYLLNTVDLNKMQKIRKHLSTLSESESISLLLNKLHKTTTNDEFLNELKV